MGCQTKIAEAIRDKGADYLLGLKDNWPVPRAEVERFLANPRADTCAHHDTCDGGHGRVEIRRHAVCYDIDGLKRNRRFPGEWRFQDLAMMARVEAEVGRDGKTSVEPRREQAAEALERRLEQAAEEARSRPAQARLHGCTPTGM